MVRTVFFGTPAIAVSALDAVREITQVVGVVSQPDRPAGRGLQLASSAVKRYAVEHDLPLYQPEKLRTGALQAWLSVQQPDVIVVMAYGRILPKEILDLPPHGCLNLHASLLPRWRGAAPIEWAIMSGDRQTGISLMHMDAGLDTGAVFSREAIEIGPNTTSAQLAVQLAELSAKLIVQDLPRVIDGTLVAMPQDELGVTYAPPLEGAIAAVDFRQPARRVHDLVRALQPRPGAYAFVTGRRLKLLSTQVFTDAPSQSDAALAPEPGTVVEALRDRILVQADPGLVQVIQAQVEGKRPASAVELINGRVLRAGLVLRPSHQPRE